MENKKICIAIDTKDKTYNNYVDGKISINEFIKYSIKKNWIYIAHSSSDILYLLSRMQYALCFKTSVSALEEHIFD